MFKIFPDKHWRPIEVGDLVKIFHFTEARRKRHYMYKLVGIKSGRLVGYDATQVAHLVARGLRADCAHYCEIELIHREDIEILDGGEAWSYIGPDGEKMMDIEFVYERKSIKKKLEALGVDVSPRSTLEEGE